jgi:hypothetical protein
VQFPEKEYINGIFVTVCSYGEVANMVRKFTVAVWKVALVGGNIKGVMEKPGFLYKGRLSFRLKVPKCEIFYLFDFSDFYVINPL